MTTALTAAPSDRDRAVQVVHAAHERAGAKRPPRVLAPVVGCLVLHAAEYALLVVAWAGIGSAAARGGLGGGDILRWAVAATALAGLHTAAIRSAGTAAQRLGTRQQRRVFTSILRLDPDAARAVGPGRLLGGVLEAEALESLLVSGAFNALTGCVEFVVAGAVLAFGADNPLLVLVLSGSGVLTAITGRALVRSRRRWTDTRAQATHGLLERLAGHRTRLAQEGAALHDHTTEHAELAALNLAATRMDRRAVTMQGVMPRAFGVVAVAVLLAQRDSGAATTAASIAGILLATGALRRLALGAGDLAGAAVARERLLSLHRTQLPPVRQHTPPPGRDVVVQAAAATYAYPDRAVAGVAFADLAIRRGERVAIDGPSGAGKSTLAALLAGVRPAHRGVVRHGAEVVLVPQVAENHLFSASLAFNLLLGRQWPPGPIDLTAADETCRALGLGPLLDAMPAGLAQPVGETGWQLSHGERARVCLARALLAEPDVLFVDDVFAALDPELRTEVRQVVLDRVPTIVAVGDA